MKKTKKINGGAALNSRKKKRRRYKNTLQKILLSQVKPGITKYRLVMMIINGHSGELVSPNGVQRGNEFFRLPLDILFLNGIYPGCSTLVGGFNTAELERDMLKTINKGKEGGYDDFQLSKTGEKTENYVVIFNRAANESISEPYDPINNATGILTCETIDLELLNNRFNLQGIIPKIYSDPEENPRIEDTETTPFMNLEDILLKINETYDFVEREELEPDTGILKLVMCCYCRGDLVPNRADSNSNGPATNFNTSNSNNETLNRYIRKAFNRKAFKNN